MRAGTLDVVIETGAAWQRQIQVFKPDTPITLAAVAPGQRVFVDGAPLLVYSVTPAAGGRVVLTFGRGLYSDPAMTFMGASLVAPAILVAVLEVAAAYTIVVTDPATDVDVVTTVEIPATIAPDGLAFTLGLDADTTAAMVDLPAAVSWDCYTRTDEWGWQRTLEGTLSTIRGDAR